MEDREASRRKKSIFKGSEEGQCEPCKAAELWNNLRALDCKYLFWMEGRLSIDSDGPSEEQLRSVRKLRLAQGSR